MVDLAGRAAASTSFAVLAGCRAGRVAGTSFAVLVGLAASTPFAVQVVLVLLAAAVGPTSTSFAGLAVLAAGTDCIGHAWLVRPQPAVSSSS